MAAVSHGTSVWALLLAQGAARSHTNRLLLTKLIVITSVSRFKLRPWPHKKYNPDCYLILCLKQIQFKHKKAVAFLLRWELISLSERQYWGIRRRANNSEKNKTENKDTILSGPEKHWHSLFINFSHFHSNYTALHGIPAQVLTTILERIRFVIPIISLLTQLCHFSDSNNTQIWLLTIKPQWQYACMSWTLAKADKLFPDAELI